MKPRSAWHIVLVLVLLLSTIPMGGANAADITVETTSDVLDAAMDCDSVAVGSPGPDGVYSLREAICAANNNAGSDAILFEIPEEQCDKDTGVCTITPESALPTLTDDYTTIDGYSQTGAMEATMRDPAVLKIEIEGSSAGSAHGLLVMAGRNMIKGLVINRFEQTGVRLEGSEARGNVIRGNYIGLDPSGLLDLGNGWRGVDLAGGAQGNVIGGDAPAARNLISGNGQFGVYFHGSETSGNTLSGNYIGTDFSGSANLGNTMDGIRVSNSANNNTIGGDTAGARNLISGNGWDGILINNAGSDGNQVAGNYIGTNAQGLLALGNGTSGIHITGGAQENTIGGDESGEGNLISGNGADGVLIDSSNTISNTVSGNFIGVDFTGEATLGNDESGVKITGGAHDNTIGGGGAPERNLISGNTLSGINISSSNGNLVLGNYIGVDIHGTACLPNEDDGVFISNGAQNNIVGGDTSAERNVITCNNDRGVRLGGANTSGNIIKGNFIGAGADGMTVLGNGTDGVAANFDALNNTIGPNNLVAFNTEDGVKVDGAATYGNVITQNSVYSNTLGIRLSNGGNHSIPPPSITSLTGGTGGMVNVEGTACAGCTVEVFANSNDDGEGETYLGSAVADGGGDFSIAIDPLDLLHGPHLTATATDAADGTSQFSDVYTADWRFIFLPVVMKAS